MLVYRHLEYDEGNDAPWQFQFHWAGIWRQISLLNDVGAPAFN